MLKDKFNLLMMFVENRQIKIMIPPFCIGEKVKRSSNLINPFSSNEKENKNFFPNFFY